MGSEKIVKITYEVLSHGQPRAYADDVNKYKVSIDGLKLEEELTKNIIEYFIWSIDFHSKNIIRESDIRKWYDAYMKNTVKDKDQYIVTIIVPFKD